MVAMKNAFLMRTGFCVFILSLPPRLSALAASNQQEGVIVQRMGSGVPLSHLAGHPLQASFFDFFYGRNTIGPCHGVM